MRIEWPFGRRAYKSRAFRQPRIWSNRVLRTISPLFTGSVINVSAWQDEDKEGGRYVDYFTSASGYSISNYTGDCGATGRADEVILDLSRDLPDGLRRGFDVVFNHTTLEHIYDVRKAFSNLCDMSRDVVIVVVPFMQPSHITSSYEDYWRFTPQALRKMFAEQGLTVVFESSNHPTHTGVYVLTVAARDPEKWREKLPPSRVCDDDLGCHVFQATHLWRRLSNRIMRRQGS